MIQFESKEHARHFLKGILLGLLMTVGALAYCAMVATALVWGYTGLVWFLSVIPFVGLIGPAVWKLMEKEDD